MRITPLISTSNTSSSSFPSVVHQSSSREEGGGVKEIHRQKSLPSVVDQSSSREEGGGVKKIHRQKSRSEVDGTVKNNFVESTSGLEKDSLLQVSSPGMVFILSDHFKVLSEPSFSKSRLKKCSVRLTDTHLSWGSFESQSILDGSNLNVLPIQEVIGTQVKDGSNLNVLPIQEVIGRQVKDGNLTRNVTSTGSTSTVSVQVKDGNLTRNVTSTGSTVRVDSVAISVFAYPFKDNPSRSIYNSKSIPRRVRKTVTFIIDSGSSYRENQDTADQWSRAIEWLVFDKTLVKASNRICDVTIPAGHPFKRNILVMINPASGPGKAGNIFHEKVAPLLDEGGVKYQVWCTTSAGSASDYIANCSLYEWNGIVIVSGDGLVYELFNGLMRRKDYETAIKTPVGVIPGGSGNGLAHSVNFYVGENTANPILSSTLNIVRGRITPMDLIKVEMKNETVYSFLSIGWGLLADIDIESERLRMVGGFRFTVWALIRIFSLKKYRGTLSYLPVAGYDQFRNPFNGDISSSVKSQSNGVKSEEKKKNETFVPPGLNEPVPSDWITVTGEFILVYSGHQSHLSGDCFFAPAARLDDGVIWLVFIQSGLSKAQLLTFMTSLESGQHCDLPFITMVPVKAFRLVPFQDEGRLTVDGELVPTGPVQASVLPSVARIMSR